MYYYIAEPVTTSAERRQIEGVKALLSQLGIAGEFAVASPARKVEEHLELAFSKGFTTVVGIGSDALLNKVAGQMLTSRYDKAVLGAIPLRSDQAVWSMIGAKNLTELGEMLRLRRLTQIDAIELGNGKAFIMEAQMVSPRPVKFKLRYNQAEIYGLCTHIVVNTTGEVRLWDATFQSSGGFLSRLFNFRKHSESSLTHLIADRWGLVTEQPVDFMVSGQTVAQTPFQVIRRPKALKLVVNRAKIAPEKTTTDSKE